MEVEWCGLAILETRPGQWRLNAVIAARRAVCTGMETGQGSGGHTCGETTANLTRDDYKATVKFLQVSDRRSRKKR